MKKLEKELEKHADKKQAGLLQRFFKTKPGGYGEGDRFLGIKVPVQREIAKQAGERILFDGIKELLNSDIHEKRLIGLLILIDKYNKAEKQGNRKEQEKIFNLYLGFAGKDRINNWDLVDLSAPNIIGNFLSDKKEKRKILYKLAKSKNLWERRIAVVSCFAFIRKNDFSDALKISKILLKDKHDLINKAVGWMLREIGKRDEKVLTEFLNQNYKNMPRTTLRYAIERFDEKRRKEFLNGQI